MKQIDPAIAKTASKLATEIAARFDEVHGRTEDWLNENFRRQTVDRIARDVIAEFLSSRQSSAVALEALMGAITRAQCQPTPELSAAYERARSILDQVRG